ncbi:Xaa-Pro dipeptidyl-peptidase [Candidatus Solirubrobacter pratensis]|uniref:Xaa-Pro dipeptidyl-peptidase n=1 Tax=Candidatus Solirubrobacter pratensis TaxID=1298857 RepID=UPI0003F66721|nr:Xaa-Pro dipeptidyl-peptidase [Candidatus Solirubrobacter pratensis]
MRFRFLGVAATATAMAAVVGTSSASALPLLTTAEKPAALAPPAPAPAGAVPTFVNGLAQAVFTTDQTKWVRNEGWVQTTFDSDNDGKLDRVHFDVIRPPETETDGLKVPVIFEDSPYYANTAAKYSNWVVDHELGAQPPERPLAPFWPGRNTSPKVSSSDIYAAQWVPRGFAVVHADSPGTGNSDGCPTSGGRNETLGAKAVIDWLNGRAPAYTTRAGSTPLVASWTTGKVGMMGTSYNGTLPIAAATTGVQGLDAIVPISAISDWYDYYRANGMVRAPHSRTGGTGTNSYLGEDLDVLVDDVYSRQDENAAGARTICVPVIDDIRVQEDRLTGNRNAFWDERDYMKDVQNVHAAALIAHGNNDFNVMTKNAAQFLDALKNQGVPHEFYFHQGGHGGAPPDVLVNRWFTRYLYGVQNGVENMPKSYVVREPATCPTRQSTVTGDQSNTATLTVADTSALPLGYYLTIPQQNADGTVTNVVRQITDVPDATHLTLASAVATGAGQKVAAGATVFMLCQNPSGTQPTYTNPTAYSEWPDPASAPVVQRLLPGGGTRGNLTLGAGGTAQETLTDDASKEDQALLDAPSSGNRLVYQSNPLTKDVRISGTPSVTLRMAFSKPKANLSAALISYPATGGSGTVLTRGWLDPENRNSDYVSDPIAPGTFYTLEFDMQAKDAIVPAGRRLGLMVFSSDRQYTIRPAAGTQLTLDLAGSSITIPVVGGTSALATATGTDIENGGASGTVPATLSLTLGAPASFGAFTPGVANDYSAATTAKVVSTAGDATLSVSDPGHLANGAFSLPDPLQVTLSKSSWTGPVSNDVVDVAFKQHINATDPLRTGTYSRTLTFTLSTTQP